MTSEVTKKKIIFKYIFFLQSNKSTQINN
ncbi:hypothetical protein Pint_10762 [Pistacia integerrima]|uniref:Uncharacterized protein n=2 Tax=Pistacia TaxID=55512 RepID=A0ACC0ZRZ0_9ROSI|nr:hypothetical protein Pint_10762 [Pistacia integerrima]KAJ0075522.1 hypothetical protein Patl1_34907 [Pistacia atlantica]